MSPWDMEPIPDDGTRLILLIHFSQTLWHLPFIHSCQTEWQRDKTCSKDRKFGMLTLYNPFIYHFENVPFCFAPCSCCSHVSRWAGHERPSDRRRAERSAVRPARWWMGLPHAGRGVRTHHQSHRPTLHARYDVTSSSLYVKVKLSHRLISSSFESPFWAHQHRNRLVEY